MRVSTTVRGGLTLLALAVLNACADAPSSPLAGRQPIDRATLRDVLRSVSTQAAGAEQSAARVAAYVEGDTGTYTVLLDPATPFNELVGPHFVRIPAGSVCDIASTAYGTDHWAESCERQTEPFELTIAWAVKDGHASVTFSPDLRFRPSDDPSDWVVLSLKDPNVTMNSDVLWNHDGAWINESASDAELWSFVDPVTERVTRRLKHFSGYQVWGFADEL